MMRFLFLFLQKLLKSRKKTQSASQPLVFRGAIGAPVPACPSGLGVHSPFIVPLFVPLGKKMQTSSAAALPDRPARGV
jgi:hypothetical protein